jgi:hypothetical protein
MQAAKRPGLAEEFHGEQTKWQKTYGQPFPYRTPCIDEIVTVLNALVNLAKRSEAGRWLLPAIKDEPSHLGYLGSGQVPQRAVWVKRKPPPKGFRLSPIP